MAWKLFRTNNQWLILAAKIIAGLFAFWFFFGRNKKQAMHLRHYPPEGITPAEAGYLWDDKLHKKDLISLIWYWAAEGYIQIEEIKNGASRDYKLTKIGHPGSKAKNYELTLFSELFQHGKKSVMVSSLRYSFAGTMKKAHRQLIQFANTNKFYEPGSKSFALILRVIGVIAILAFILIIIIALMEYDYSMILAGGAVVFAIFFFARHMPKKGPFGAKKYAEITGFYEFLKNTDMDELDKIVEKDKQYFEKTIPYAVVFGLSHEWANRFNDYLLEQPTWYKGMNENSVFNTGLFTRSMLAGMHKMKSDFTAVYTPPSTSSSGGSSYSGGGGSSFSGGGYSSGGGFGGGGGSSW